MLCRFSQLILPVPGKSRDHKACEASKIWYAFIKWRILDMHTWNQLGISSWEFFALYCLPQRGRIVYMLSVRKYDCSCPTGLFLWIRMTKGRYSTWCIWNILFKLPLLYMTQNESYPVFMHSTDAAAHSTPCPRACSQSAVQRMSTSSGA